ncbi:MAG: Hpt domain-containing protein, partial [Pyrinomonadaceae bacterium]
MSDELQFDSDELAELRGIFFEQATEVLDSLGELLVKVESDPTDTEALRSIRRAVHTLKGDSTAFGFSELTELAHHYEDALDRLRSREEQAASRALVDLLLAGADALTALVNYYRGECPMPDTEQLIAGLAALHETEHAPATTEGTSQGDGDHQPAPALKGEMEAMGPAQAGATAEAETEEIVGISEGAGQFDERRGGVDRRQSGDRRQPQALTLRVESERIDAAMNLVGELIIQRSMIATISAEMDQERSGDELVRRLQEALALTGRSLSELQESVMRMRLVAIDQVFKRFPRVVRDSGVKLGKPLRLEVSGGNTEIDKSIVELISDPLIHL